MAKHPEKSEKRPPAARAPRALVAASILLALVTFAVYAQVLGHEFVSFDDAAYVVDNPHVQKGLTPASFAWAWTTFHASNWHPVTWLSHLIDCELWGLRPMGHHLTSLVLHVTNSVLLLWILFLYTKSEWKSAFVAALFALHPQHVESVAWIAERKDVLSTLFWLLTMWAYWSYVQKPGPRRYVLVFVFFAVGLMAKPMLVTLPLVLLLLDYWPLQRLNLGDRASIRSALLEKTPLFVASIASGCVTVFAQKAGAAVMPLQALSLSDRAATALVSCATYLTKTFWPTGLTFYYPNPGRWPTGRLVASAALLAGASIAVILARRRYLIAGWLWYIATLAPVIGLFQVGSQARADRYTYIPLVGVFVMIAWGAPDLLARVVRERPLASAASPVLAGLAAVATVALGICTFVQAGYWRDSEVLARRALSVTRGNWMAHDQLGYVFTKRGRFEDAAQEYTQVVQLTPDWAAAHFNLGSSLKDLGRLDEATTEFETAVRLKPDYADARISLGAALMLRGRLDDAESHLREAVRLEPDAALPRCNLAMLYGVRRAFSAAWDELDQCQRLGGQPDPRFVAALTREAPRSTP